MSPTGTILLPLLVVLAAACGPKSAGDTPAPVQEWLCSGRGDVAEIKQRVEAGSREDAIEKFKKAHTDVATAFCTPNPRR
jgi:hypothetical protein